MGLRTGYKESIVNLAADMTYDATGDILTIKDVGVFAAANSIKVSLQAPRAARLSTALAEKITFAASATTTAVQNVAITVKFKSIQDAPGFENMLTAGTKELKFAFIMPIGASTATSTAAAAAMVLALNGNADAYGINVAANAAGVVTIKYNDPSVYLDSIIIEGEHGTSTVMGATILATGSGWLAPDMGRGTAKQLYESVRLGTGVNYKPFEHTAERQVNMNKTYYILSFDYLYNGPSGVIGIDELSTRRSEFIIYINEDAITTPTDAATDAPNVFFTDCGTEVSTVDAWLTSNITPLYLSATDAVGRPTS